ncbi:peptide synthetase [Gordonia defluvii]|uniref:Peptide synthetase n=1 Tax=Gordonia defluvii TaxID=283718 RepID=A0ABP6LN97_9ACTN|nr:GNAT family N-acetyltransferase [Gordonia sp. UBA5067]
MRLTNVAHLRLPFGRLMGYDVSISEPGTRLPLSFDQRRHVAAGDRGGSWMALSFRLPGAVSLDALAQAWLAVIARHGTLRTVIVRGEAGEPELAEVEIGAGSWVEHPVGAGQAVNDAMREVLDRTCSSYSRPAHRLCVLATAAGPTIVVAADHSHVDMWSMLVILRDLRTALGQIEAGGPATLAQVPAFVEHTRALRERPPAPADVKHRWAEILADSGGVMPLFPLPLGTAVPHAERVEVRDVFDVDDSAAFSAQARAEGTSTLALVVTAMTAVTREMAEVPLRAVFPVHSRYDETWHDSVGWFITNSVLESDVAHPGAASAAVREAVRLGSWPLEDVLAPWGGMPEEPGMFAISWLDLRRLPVRVDAAGLGAQYVGATITTDGVMLWFILDGSGLHLRCRYPDTPEARTNVGGWLDRLVATLQAGARSSVGGIVRDRDGAPLRVQRATRVDVPDIVALLRDDTIGGSREVQDYAPYEAAYDVVARDRTHYLAVVRADDDEIVGTMQLTVLPGLSRGGTTRLQIEGLRVARAHRSRGVGTAMLAWAHEHGRSHGATLAQVTTDEVRERARDFYARLGYTANHVGLKRTL